MKNILVTGADGFIGQHLVKQLINTGYTVRGTRHIKQQLYFIKEEDIEWRTINLQDPGSLIGIAENIDTVFHLAAIPRNDLSKSWDDFHSVNVLGTKYLLEQAKASGVKRFVYISTVEAAGFGDGTNPRKESDEPNPDNNYGKSKLAAEKIVLDGSWPFECTVIRLPMIYGPGTFLIVPKLFGMVARGFYPLIGSGKTLMEFCYVENAVEGIVLCGEKKEAEGQLFIVSNERSYTIREVVSSIASSMKKNVVLIKIPKWFAYIVALLWETVARAFPFPPIISPVSKKAFFTRETVWWTTRNVNIVSTEKIRTMLGYKPKISIENGCCLTTEWLRSQKAI